MLNVHNIVSPTKPQQLSATEVRPPLFVTQLPVDRDGRQIIRRVLIANRGEIACRIIATCGKLNITSIATYTEEDATSRHVSSADESISLGSVNQPGGNPFLNIQLLTEIATSTNADAVHPGYGYLSENGDFAQAIRQAGIIFIGPGTEAMATLGDKRNSKAYLRKYAPSIPLIPGFAGSSQNIEDLKAAAERIGFPVMLKASAGGGGRGMRIVRQMSDLKDELERAQSEALRSFGSSDCILEKYIEAAKHIEVQIIGDSHGQVLSLWERECSVQRRHQKVIEETPSPFLNNEQRKRICAAAVEIGKLISYEGAGTVEFVVNTEDGSFYFLEVNTRLQVEHPITEEVTGLDIVALQLFAATEGNFNDVLGLREIPQSGHAIECRLCAEDPLSNFSPETGIIRLWKEADHATKSRDVRFETAVTTGSNVSVHFDSMIAKIVVWAPTREQAISKMVKIMADTVCAGVRTNQLFLQSCLLHPAFHNPAYTTSFITTHLPELLKNPHLSRSSAMVSMLSVVPGLVLRETASDHGNQPFSHVRRGFRSQKFDPVSLDTSLTEIIDPSVPGAPMVSVWESPSKALPKTYTATIFPMAELKKGTAKMSISAEISSRYNAVSDQLRNIATTPLEFHQVQLSRWKYLSADDFTNESWKTALLEVVINSSKIHAYIAFKNVSSPGSLDRGTYRSVICHFPALGTWVEYQCFSLLTFFENLREAFNEADRPASKSVKAPMPCKVLSILKKNGDEVKAHETVMVIESMKMETNISIGADGKFQTTLQQGQAVDDGKLLCWVD